MLMVVVVVVALFVLPSCNNSVGMAGKNEAAIQEQKFSKKTTKSFTLNAGELKIVKVGDNDIDVAYFVELNGQTLTTIKERYVDIHAYLNPPDLGEIVILSKANGGNACPAKFHLIEFPMNGKPYVTNEFGTCDESPVIVQDDEKIIMKFRPALPLNKNRSRYNTPPSSVWEYSASRLKRLR
jgi:hypothetical protein